MSRGHWANGQGPMGQWGRVNRPGTIGQRNRDMDNGAVEQDKGKWAKGYEYIVSNSVLKICVPRLVGTILDSDQAQNHSHTNLA